MSNWIDEAKKTAQKEKEDEKFYFHLAIDEEKRKIETLLGEAKKQGLRVNESVEGYTDNGNNTGAYKQFSYRGICMVYATYWEIRGPDKGYCKIVLGANKNSSAAGWGPSITVQKAEHKIKEMLMYCYKK